jgi:hypothetical protein
LYDWRWWVFFITCARGKLIGNLRGIFEEAFMPREAKLFSSSSGSVVRGFLKYRANIPPRWIRNARTSRKRIEPEIVQSIESLKRLRKTRPRAQVAIKNASKEMRAVLNRWETAYNKENFYRGIRILLELGRNGSSNL